MLERIEGIVTDIVKHNDRHNVVTLFTRTRGRMAFLVPVGASKSGRMRNASLQLMAVLSADVNVRQGKELYTLRQVQPVRLWHGIYSHPVKTALLFFITEFCHRLLRQYPADEKLWEYLIGVLELLDEIDSRRCANFHIAFLVRLMPLAGIEPAVSAPEPDERFDMISAEMVDAHRRAFLRRVQLLDEKESRAIPTLMRMNFSNMHRFRFSAAQRSEVLTRILDYYAVHLPIGSEYKSLEVLHELFR